MNKTARKYDDVPLHGAEGFEAMRKAGRTAAELLDHITPFVQPGITTAEIDEIAVKWTSERNLTNGPKNYRGFPRSICTSVNHVVCHGIPGDKKLIDGDIINIDVTPIVDGWYGDTSRMFYVGKVGVRARKLVEVTYECLMRALDVIRPGATLGDIGHAIQEHAEANRFSVVRDFCGHGVGRVFHTNPSVLHYGRPGTGMVLEEGMIFTVEPMINAGKPDAKVLQDGWTAVTKDRSLSAQFEHSIGVTADGCEIFTQSPKGWHCPPYAGA
jgi:methionyl aminopeptidase